MYTVLHSQLVKYKRIKINKTFSLIINVIKPINVINMLFTYIEVYLDILTSKDNYSLIIELIIESI